MSCLAFKEMRMASSLENIARDRVYVVGHNMAPSAFLNHENSSKAILTGLPTHLLVSPFSIINPSR